MKTWIKKRFSGITKDTALLAVSSVFSDISTEMLYPVLPIYLTQYLKASGSIVGMIEGIAQALQNSIQGFSGYLSDKWQRKKPIAMAGALLSALSKPFIGIAGSWPAVLAARSGDRLGAGIRSAPRDALVSGSVTKENRGKAFGLEGAGDNFGAFAGPVITVLLFLFFTLPIRFIFYAALIPGLLAVLMIGFTKEPKGAAEPSKISLQVRSFPVAYWRYLAVIAVFSLGNSSSSFLILTLRAKGVSLVHTVLVYAFYNLAAAIISYPAGALSDRLGRKPLLIAGFLLFMVAYSGFALSPGVTALIVLFMFYGVFQGISRAVGKSFSADFVPQQKRASAVGWYATVAGLGALVANIVAGLLWDRVGHAAVFLYAAIFSLAAIVLAIIMLPKMVRSGD